jgi:hypothetical protein
MNSLNRNLDHIVNHPERERYDRILCGRVHCLAGLQIKARTMRWTRNPAVTDTSARERFIGVRAFILDCKKKAAAIADQDRTSAVVKGKSLSAFNSINAHGTYKIRFAHPTHSFDYSQSEIALPHRHKGGIQ